MQKILIQKTKNVSRETLQNHNRWKKSNRKLTITQKHTN